MREELKKLEGQRIKYKATFDHFGEKFEFGKKEKTVVLINLYQGKQLVADHVWVEYEPDLMILEPQLHKGVQLEFYAKAKPYKKDPSFRNTGISNQFIDTSLFEIRDVKLISDV